MANSSSNSLSRGKILSGLSLIIFALLFIFSCLSKSITLGAKIVGTFGVISYPLFLGLAFLCLFKFLGFSYKRSIKATTLMICFIYCVLAVIHAIRTFSILETVASGETFKNYLGYSYSNLTVLGSIGSLLCGVVAYLLGGVGTIIVFVILGTLSIGFFIDFQLYGKYEEKHIKKLKSRKLREKVYNSGNDLNSNGTPHYSFSNDIDQYTDNDVVAEISDNLDGGRFNQNSNSYSDNDVLAETSDGNIYQSNEQYTQSSFGNNYEKNDNISPNYFGANFYNQNYESQNQYQDNGYYDSNNQNMFGSDSVSQSQNNFSENVYKEPDYPDVYDENEQRRQFMRATFSSEPTDFSSGYGTASENSYYGANQSYESSSFAGNGFNSYDGGTNQNYDSGFGSSYSETQNAYGSSSDYGSSSNYNNDESGFGSGNSEQYDLNNLYKNFNESDPYSFSVGHENNISSSDYNSDNSSGNDYGNLSDSNDFSSNSVDNKISQILSSGTETDYTSNLSNNFEDEKFNNTSFVEDGFSTSAEQDMKSNFTFDTDKKVSFKEENNYNDFDNSKIADTFSTQSHLSLSENNFNLNSSNNDFGESLISSNEPKIKIPAKENSKKFNMSMATMKYSAPSPLLLNRSEVDNGNYDEEQTRKAKKLEEVLKAFNISVSVVNIVRGPKITRYELSIPLGVSIKKIPSYELDIKKSLAAKTVNIQAPIPGSEYVGIELENDTFTNVSLRELIESNNFQNCTDPLPIAIGKDISGEIIVKSLTKMVHMLIAGQTGSGKSVFIHSIILSLIYKYSPDDLRLMLIDPKRVEFNRYNGLPHLVTPEVVLGTEKAVNALKWCVSEMDRRFNLMEKAGYNNISTYNNSEIVKSGQLPRFPYIVIVLDEFAEVIMANKKDTEACIQRITQLARACGMHLILATQRPSVDVISGVIKNNVPSRVAFSLASAFDSKTIIGTTGAENLLGQGDMLFAPSGTSVISRLQAAYCSDDEIKKVIDYVKDNNQSNYDDSVAISINSPLSKSGSGASGSGIGMPPEKEADEYTVLALKLFIQRGEASTSYLQRRLSIGYGRASRIVDNLESKGYIAPASGAKVRKVLITAEQFKEKFGEDVDDSPAGFDE